MNVSQILIISGIMNNVLAVRKIVYVESISEFVSL